jgi:TRAP-type C4-dicarboxylate transport system permease small subunit
MCRNISHGRRSVRSSIPSTLGPRVHILLAVVVHVPIVLCCAVLCKYSYVLPMDLSLIERVTLNAILFTHSELILKQERTKDLMCGT